MMKSTRAIWALMVAAVVLVVATTASAGWRGLTDLNYDDSGRVCTNAMEFSLANFPPSIVSVQVTDISADPDVVLVPLTQLPQLTFAPVPERFSLGAYLHSRSFRLDFTSPSQVGHELEIQFLGGTGATATTNEFVGSCSLQSQLKLKKPSAPPALNVPPNPSLVRIKFRLPGVSGTDIFTEGPYYDAIPCVAPATVEAQPPTPATGELRAKGNHRYVFRWEPPAGLTGCQEFWFRNVEPGLSPNELGLSHRVLFDFGSQPEPG